MAVQTVVCDVCFTTYKPLYGGGIKFPFKGFMPWLKPVVFFGDLIPETFRVFYTAPIGYFILFGGGNSEIHHGVGDFRGLIYGLS
jgi:hypothetical protein